VSGGGRVRCINLLDTKTGWASAGGQAHFCRRKYCLSRWLITKNPDMENFLKKGLESRSGVSIFRPPFLQHPAPKNAGRAKEASTKPSVLFPELFSKK
jgi:hypothetical protein